MFAVERGISRYIVYEASFIKSSRKQELILELPLNGAGRTVVFMTHENGASVLEIKWILATSRKRRRKIRRLRKVKKNPLRQSPHSLRHWKDRIDFFSIRRKNCKMSRQTSMCSIKNGALVSLPSQCKMLVPDYLPLRLPCADLPVSLLSVQTQGF